uniref:Transcription factor, putative n=1 Tax=Arundo donax TaxID=35708 RepID=A0A0A9D0S8_ARUDO
MHVGSSSLPIKFGLLLGDIGLDLIIPLIHSSSRHLLSVMKSLSISPFK